MSTARAARWSIATALTAAAVAALLGTAPAARAEETVREITVVNVEYEGTKIWVPSTLVVTRGDRVKLKLINNVPSEPNQHGFAIAAFNVAAVVDRGQPATVEFVAEQAGIFPITCHLHPAHVGGQLVVLH
jgi:nitrosocyanin